MCTVACLFCSADGLFHFHNAFHFVSQGSSSKNGNGGQREGEGPNVEAALTMSPTEAAQNQAPRKSTIGQRKPQAKKGVRETNWSILINRSFKHE